MNPDYKDNLATRLESNFLTLEDRILQDIARRIHKTGKITSTADWQINRLLILGNSSEDIENMIKETLDASYPDMFELYDQVIDWEYVRNKDVYDQVNKEFIPYEKNGYLQQMTESFMRQSGEELTNLTQSLGFLLDYNGQKVITPLAEIYQGYLDNAITDIVSGAFDYNTVIKRVASELTNSGLRTVEYASGRTARANVAARRAVMTGVSQLTGRISDYNAEKLGTDYYEVAWHAGARPTHQVWQGKVYTKEQLHTVCGLGTVTGLLGANCYHEYYPFFPGISERNWTDEWLADQIKAENTPRSYQGKEYTLYEAKQRQREMERIMRAQREKVVFMKEAHADPDEIMLMRCKYQAQLDEYSRFSKKMNLKTERARIYLDGHGRIAPSTANYKKFLLEHPDLKLLPKPRSGTMKSKKEGPMKILLDGLKTGSVTCKKPKKLKKSLSEEEIISALAGGDKTGGSCASVGLAYIGQKGGLNVLDFRGGASREFFSLYSNLRTLSKLPDAGTITETAKATLTVGNKLLKKVEEGKEYYLVVGRHASIVRRKKGTLQYLELQSATDSGWTDFDGNPRYTLGWRFGCANGRGYTEEGFMIPVDSLKDSDDLKELLGYLNTADDAQKKGVSGSVK